MKAGIIITGSGTILFLTSAESLEAPDFVKALRAKGIDKYIAFEIGGGDGAKPLRPPLQRHNGRQEAIGRFADRRCRWAEGFYEFRPGKP
jgi:hypothetical protein